MLASQWRRDVLIACLAVLLPCLANVTCPRQRRTDSSVKLRSDDPNGNGFFEISGLALSPTQIAPSGSPVLFAVNDGGGGKRLGIFDSGSGERLLTLRLDSVPAAVDFESLAIGSCGNFEGDCVYIGDVGDNWAQGSGGTDSRRGGVPYRIYKVKEPILANFADDDEVPQSDITVLEYDYDHTTSPTEFANCEAIFVDHVGWGGEVGDVFIVTKWRDSYSDLVRVFRIPASEWTDEHQSVAYSPAAVGSYDNDNTIFGKLWTMADMTLDGKLIALGELDSVHLFPRCPGTSVSDALTGRNVDACSQWDHEKSENAAQFETFAWAPDGLQNLAISECDKCDPRMSWTTMNYDNPADIIQCEAFVEDTLVPSVSPTSTSSISTQPPTIESTVAPTAALTTTTAPTGATWTNSPSETETLFPTILDVFPSQQPSSLGTHSFMLTNLICLTASLLAVVFAV